MPSWPAHHKGASRYDWNVVVTLAERTFREACQLLARWGVVKRTPYYNVLAMKVNDPEVFLAEFTAAVEATPGILNSLAHVVPAQRTFDFDRSENFETQAQEIVREWAPKLAGKSFHVRLHRRGFKSALSTQAEERLLGQALLASLGASARISFEDPDAVIQIETINGRAGLSLWTREDLRRHPFIGTA
jgi:tRNA(Ser,Leu) C12 N-acetylase TAN1